MKKLLYLLVAAISAAAIIAATWFFYRSSTSDTYILIDITNPKAEPIDATAIIKQSIADINTWGSATINVSTISNLDYNNVTTVSLPPSFVLMSNPRERQAQIDTFSQSVNQAVGDIYKIDSGRPKSSVYIPLVRFLTALSGSNAHHRNIYIASDLLENVDSFSLYSAEDLALIQNHPERVAKILGHEASIPDLHDITIYFVYKPQSGEREDEQKHLLITHLLQSLFTAHHANVVITPNISITD